jgi:predicted RNA-binding Zn-ribbon protein involved in translation (DUF1610 family)
LVFIEQHSSVNDLDRIFRQIVVNLTATDPARLRHPLSLAEIRDSIVPYRANRRALQIESSEDYEVALLRLCAGEGGLATTEPREVQEEFASELVSPNPDLTIIQKHEKAVLCLNPDALARATDPNPDRAFAPRESTEPPTMPRQPTPTPAPRALKSEPPLCKRCGGILPTGRAVNFCPQCGENLTRRRCPQCNAELEREWRHCISCGTTLSPK